ncbi:hypothetical protein NONI108955_15960 [Nocardia ninae]|uniref:Uncharacterized protein n=1 Tax=Nocardia ninae NBRC 108245 TaxID=1210091 RepID=A0A511M987_9NOCA|nr:hypothetical protein [Nocardia ninae]GEM37081.1 hypothetical protein NN4_16000 [Nocardia ninae NBRC 108245]
MRGVLGATIRYEALLVLRHRVVWLSLIPLCVLIMLLGGFPRGRDRTDEIAAIGDTALLLNFLGSIGVAVALADRLAVQRKPGLRELFAATPADGRTRSVGLVLGPWLVASVPGALILLVMGLWSAISSGGPAPLAAAVIGLVTIVAPGSLLLTVLANVASLLLPSVVVRVLVVPYWYWATLLTPLVPIPTVTGTVLSPLGGYQAAQWLNVALPQKDGGWLHPPAGAGYAALALALTLVTTALAFLVGHVLLARRRCAETEFG